MVMAARAITAATKRAMAWKRGNGNGNGNKEGNGMEDGNGERVARSDGDGNKGGRATKRARAAKGRPNEISAKGPHATLRLPPPLPPDAGDGFFCSRMFFVIFFVETHWAP